MLMNRSTRREFLRGSAAGLLAASLSLPRSTAAADPKELDAMVGKAAGFLKTKQGADGSFLAKAGPGITAVVAAGLIRNGRGDDEVVTKAISYLEKNIKPDGGIYANFQSNYNTCVALVAFSEANKGGKYDNVIKNATQFLKSIQKAGDGGDLGFGAVGYDAKSAGGDISNTTFFIDSLLAAGVPKDDPSIQRALTFISRCQNLPGEEQNQPFAKKASADDKGGFVYNPYDATKEKSEKRTAEGGLRSEGSMTYAGLKSFLYAGVGKEDSRVKAAVDWVRRHYTLDENPGLKDAGLFYYYHTFAKALDALGEDEFADASGKKHDWKKELAAKLKSIQHEDGSWANKNNAFFEGAPELATAFALLALSYCKAKK